MTKNDATESAYKNGYEAGYAKALEGVAVTLSKDEANALAFHLDDSLLDSIRKNPNFQNTLHLCDMVHLFEKLCKAGDYELYG